jgi:hypothetical protein
MTAVTDVAAAAAARVDRALLGSVAVAVVVGGGLVVAARAGATPLLVAVAVAQAALAITYVLGTSLPGRWGAIVLAAAAAVAADVSVSVWPHGRLGVLIATFALAIPAMFIHQLTRGAARVRLVASMSAIAVLLFAVIALAALPQLRHEFAGADPAGRVVAAAVAAVGAALVAGYLVDLVVPAPRIDPDVARGVPALIVALGAGTLTGFLLLRTEPGFGDGRSVFIGVVLGAVAALMSVAGGFVLADSPAPRTAVGRVARPIAAALLPYALLAPVVFLMCVAMRA